MENNHTLFQSSHVSAMAYEELENWGFKDRGILPSSSFGINVTQGDGIHGVRTSYRVFKCLGGKRSVNRWLIVIM